MNARTSVYRVLALDGQVARAREATFRIASVLCCSPAAAARLHRRLGANKVATN